MRSAPALKALSFGTDDLFLTDSPSYFAYAASNPLSFRDPLGLALVPQPFWMRCSRDLHARRVEGHNRFPGQGQPNDFLRHCTVSCEAADGTCGRFATRLAGAVNELQGLWLDIWNRQTGAFQFQDFQFNEGGLWCQGNRESCSSCEDCCRRIAPAFLLPLSAAPPPPGMIFGGP